MQITLRTLSGAPTTMEVQPSDVVRTVKDSLASEYDMATLKLCFKGKVLEDNKTFEELGFAGGEMVIIAGKKLSAVPKPAQAPAPASTTAPAPQPAVAATAPVTATASAPVTAPSVPAPLAPAPAVQAPAPQPSVAPAAPAATEGVDPALIDSLVAMGFEDRTQVALALRAAYMNPDRAVEYLCTGIPPHVLQQMARENQQRAQPAAAQRAAVNAPAPQAQAQAGGGASVLRQALMSIPQIEQIREVVRQNPQTLPTVMQQLREHHPNVFQVVQQNAQEFIEIMNEAGPIADGDMAGGIEQALSPENLQLTPADAEPVQRLVALGGGMWDARAAGIVYVLSNRNEELAANVLFDNGGLPAELAVALANGGLGGSAEEGGSGDDDQEEES